MIKYDYAFPFLFGASLLVASVSGLLQIKELKVPTAVRSGDVDEIILDCEYEVKGEKGVEVKWFYNGDKDQIYQWIPGTNSPGFSMGSLKNNIDATFQATDDKLTMYRALKLVNVTYELTGSYTCKVSGYTEEATATKNLTIYVPPTEGLNLTVTPEDLSAACSVNGVFPEPSVSLVIQKGNITDNPSDIKEEVDKENGLYNKAITITFENDSTISTSEFICVMKIPGTEYEITETRLFSKDNFSMRPQLNFLLLQFWVLIVFLQ
ncbi:uncharacterized protein LOC123313351 [Coccinella septempunctata]|uniref:uncharacterized protein LOC123313351 n=1 Tax=Coccinella septempunctata TaxID=41139 RepID=UPI001D06DBB0|nr:uncharacterized protein LOC123313351 [Coccinella septempunctata]